MLRRILREPLLYFLAAGAALFGVGHVVAGDDEPVIVVDDARRAQLAGQWEVEMGRPPTTEQLDALVEQWIRQEVYYREALAMGLDRDDVIIRRRLAQKLTFLSEDLTPADPVTPADVQTYFREHAGRYAEPARISFQHVFFDPEQRTDARADARRAAEALADGDDAPSGDAFLLPRSFAGRSAADVGQLFGDEFADAVMDLPEGGWRGPVHSAYGWHLVRIVQRLPARQPTFGEVVNRVTADYEEDRRRRANETYYRHLLDRYQVVRR